MSEKKDIAKVKPKKPKSRQVQPSTQLSQQINDPRLLRLANEIRRFGSGESRG